MSKSGDKINYSIRPAKGIERKLIGDSLLGIVLGFGVKNYTYIGFGSKYFVDFLFFHRHLHIEKMISIEVDEENYLVYEFNKPLSCIGLEFGLSGDVLPTLQYNYPIFAWLDYDGVFERSMLEDLDELIRRSESGSVILLSYNSRPYNRTQLSVKHKTDGLEGAIRKELIEKLGDEVVPSDLEERGLGQWKNFSKLLRGFVNNYIRAALADKNNGREDPFCYEQMFYFDYKDGVEMSTIGGVIFKESDRDKVFGNGSLDFPFIRAGAERCLIDVPPLTPKESRELLSCMPINESEVLELEKKGVFKKSVIESFNEFYKYYPKFAEVEF